ncbi:hypothetical protein MYX77_14280, partial [Acidobacteriia bacterium AH_259_A11_L15]|nr:hypothetical protein [Acidobacteriia bacterium AH_259_A11_L15]
LSNIVCTTVAIFPLSTFIEFSEAGGISTIKEISFARTFALASHRLYKKHPETVALYYLRNFFGLWSVCTFFSGIIAVVGIQPPLKA